MKRLSILCGLLCTLNLLYAQDSLLLRYMNTITAGELSEHVHKLASPQFEGRNTGSEGIRMAAEYIRGDFKEMGLQSAYRQEDQPYFQSFVLDKCYWQDQQLSSGLNFLSAVDDYVFLSDPMTINEEFPVIFSGFGLDDSAYSDYTNLEVTGKLVLAFSGEPRGSDGRYFISGEKQPSRQSYFFNKMRVAKEKGAAGLLLIARESKDYRRYTGDMDDVLSRPDISYPGESVQDTFFTVYLSQEAAAGILKVPVKTLEDIINATQAEHRSMAGSYKSFLSVNTSQECYAMNTENVLGIVEGTDLKNEAVIVVAHYDHLGKKDGKIYFGADDNASGTSAVMEIAEAFAQAKADGFPTRRTVIFMAVTAEELGLHGSRYYSENPAIPLENTVACVNIDMIGRVGEKHKKDPDYVAGAAFISEEILEIARNASGLADPGIEFRMAFRDHITGGSDHYYFAKNGIPSLFYFEGVHKDYHEPGDTADKILYDRMESITRGIFATVWELANRSFEF